jgi:hypothetical protein
MTKTFNHISSTARLGLVEEQPDFFDRLKLEWDRTGGTTMPAGPLADAYHMKWTYLPYKMENGVMNTTASLNYKVDVHWAKHVPMLVKHIEPHQVWHRSRIIALAIDALRTNEMQRRVSKITDGINDYRKAACKDRESHEINQIVLEETKKHMHLNYEHIHKYIMDHKRSSLGGGGFKWRMALEMPRSEWDEVRQILFENIELMQTHPTWYVSNYPRTGERARSASLEAVSTHYDVDIDRTRIITFGNFMSLYTVFIVDKASWYQTVLTKCLDLLQPSGDYYFPYMEGGNIYQIFSDLHKTDEPYHAYDGRTWDAGAGIILGPYMNCFMVPIGGVPQVASGQSHTSMNGTIATVIASRNLNGVKCVLGDDCAHYGRDQIKTNVLELEPSDTKYKYNLGLTYAVDPDRPRISGMKITKDRGIDMISVNTMEFYELEGVYGGKHSREERVAHAGMYLGQFGSGTLLDRIKKLPPNNWKNPGELLEEIVESGAEDTWAWAEELGVKEVFM